MTSAFWACAVVTSLSAVISTGFSLAALRSSGNALVGAMYTSSRSIALAIASFVPIFTGSRSWLMAIAVAMVTVQALDALIGIKQHDVMKTAGPATLSSLNLVVLVWLTVGS